MSELVDLEGRPHENMVRAAVSADLGNLLLASVSDLEKRLLLEEAIVAHGHDMLECGRTLGPDDYQELVAAETGRAYLRGMFDTWKILL